MRHEEDEDVSGSDATVGFKWLCRQGCGFSFRGQPSSYVPPVELSKSWKYALIGGVIPAAFTVGTCCGQRRISPLRGFLGGVVAGYLVGRHGGVGTAAGIRAGLIGGVPALCVADRLSVAIPTIPIRFGSGSSASDSPSSLACYCWASRWQSAAWPAVSAAGWLSNRAIRGSPRRGVDPAVAREQGQQSEESGSS